jgi:DnaJ-class molecular chaperone
MVTIVCAPGSSECPRCDGHGDYPSCIAGDIVGCEVCGGRGELVTVFRRAYLARAGNLAVCDVCYGWAWCAQVGEQMVCAACVRRREQARTLYKLWHAIVEAPAALAAWAQHVAQPDEPF